MYLSADLFYLFLKSMTIYLTIFQMEQYVCCKGQNVNNKNIRREKYEKIKENSQRLYRHWYTNGMVLKGAMHMSQRKVSTTHATAEQQSEQKICNEQVAATFYIPANTKKIKEKEDSW